MLATLTGQFFTGWHDNNSDLQEMGLPQLSLGQYASSGHFLEATFENWESEFLQMGLYVVLTIWLRQRGSSESKKLYEEEEVDKEPDPDKYDAPRPVKRGGVAVGAVSSFPEYSVLHPVFWGVLATREGRGRSIQH